MNTNASSTLLLAIISVAAMACQSTRAASVDGSARDFAPAADLGHDRSSEGPRADGSTTFRWAWHAHFPVDLTRIWGTATDDVYAIGSARGGTTRPAILHFDGTRWAEVRMPVFTAPSVFGLTSIWGTSSSDIFVADGGNGHSTLLHSDGAVWSVVDSTPTMYIYGLSGLGTKDLYAVGAGAGGGVLFWYDRMTWKSIPFDFRLPSVDAPIYLGQMWGTSPSDIFVGGGFSVPQGTEAPSVLLHYDGDSWAALGTFPSQTGVGAIWGTGPLDVYVAVIGNETTGSSLHHYDGLHLSPVDIPLSPGDGIADIWGTGRGELFAVGRSIYHRMSSGWSITGVPDGVEDVQGLIGVWGAAPDDVWAIASGGDIFHYGR